ncbi:DEAD/DEAH box helicase [Gloeothece verrucosa]|uniref:DEAD/DEAH box helicase domain protein n=1 Tax=Gloeothece verrucosa (strain PCC 7822) TaxID=497965 RepID=E0U6M3_GLOV7|nr:DEAD/DEAH box helicase [Gloeothece verrucosa]ADN14782.1 DEAD/DEAH box helicase domain protein [Gloeothece verrucosa PCC 7822]
MATFRTSISKNDHAITRPHILVTTAESLDRLYLNPKPDFENYLRQLTGIVFDEVHLYHSVYGVHIYHLVRRLEELKNGQCLTRIASSATISDPGGFIRNFFYGNSHNSVLVHDASNYEQEPAGLEVLYFLQSPEELNIGAASTLIQSVMAMGHGVLSNDDRAIVFSDSLDMAGRLTAQIKDAEENKRTPDLHQESLTELSTTFIPYKTVYRYHPAPFLSVLDIEHHPNWVSDDRQTVTVRLNCEGVKQENFQFPKKVYVKPLYSDEQGNQTVKFCPQCYAIYSISRSRCSCHQDLQAVKLYAEPIVERSYEALVEPRQIRASFNILEKMQGTTTVRGSSVVAKRLFWHPQDGCYRPQRHTQAYNFNALYDIPVRYSIPTKGIVWSLTGIVEQLLQDNSLRQQVEQPVINGQHKNLNEELILHTAAHILHRAIASISGVNEQELEYWCDIPNHEVIVWERYEGGAGISEVFENTLRTNAVEVYQELLASVLCPVDLAENPNWTSPEQLCSELAQRWGLAEDHELIVRIVQEAEAERHVNTQQEEERICHDDDGCPACIHTTYCTERNNQVLSVSRMVGEQILHWFMQTINTED